MLLALILACSLGQGPDASEVQEAVAEQALAVAMEAHWDAGEALRDASVRGRTEEAKEAAKRIRDDEVAVPAALKSTHEQLQAAAGRVVAAPDAVSVARAAAEVTSLCGSCHAQAGAQIDLLPRLPKPEGDADLAMVWHQLGNIHLWAGLVSQDAERWRHGADLLAKATFNIDDGTAAGGKGAELEARLHGIAARAATADQAEWPKLYSQAVATCAECHGH